MTKERKQRNYVFLLTLSVLAVLAILFVSFPLVRADFSISTKMETNVVCPTATIVIEDVVSSTSAASFTVSVGGTASRFTTTVPFGFYLEAGERRSIFSYITPSSRVVPGNYELVVKVESGGEVKEAVHNIIVENCHRTLFTIKEKEKDMCACEEIFFDLELVNNGNYLENYKLYVEGPAWIELSSRSLSLAPNQSALIAAYARPPCDVRGSYEFGVVAEASHVLESVGGKVNVELCYDYTIDAEKNYYRICEGDKLTVPVRMRNLGAADNIFEINFDGPGWASSEKNELEVKRASDGIFNLVANPPFQTEGSFTLAIETLSRYGNVMKEEEVQVEVIRCYDVLVNVLREEDRICNALSNTYSVVVRNTGNFTNSYDISLEAPKWVDVDEKYVILNLGEEKTLTLDVHPPYDAPASTNDIIVKARDPISGIESEDTIRITTVTMDECYLPSITTEKSEVEVARDSSGTVLFIIENKGSEKASYVIEISGTAASFSQINPGTMEIEPTKAQTLYLYMAPPPETEIGDYSATINVRVEDTTITSTKSITINVIEKVEIEELEEIIEELEEIEEEEVEEEVVEGPSVWSKVWQFIASLFTPRREAEVEKMKEELEREEEALEEEMRKELEENLPPVLREDIPDITLASGEETSIDLLDYFEDPNNDVMFFTTIKPVNISVAFSSASVVVLRPDEGFTGERKINFFASDGIETTQSNEVMIVVE